MHELKLRRRVGIAGINPYVLLTAEEAGLLKAGWRKPMPVIVRINGADDAWTTNIMPAGAGHFRLYLHGAMRRSAGIEVGDEVAVRVSFDAHYRGGPIHPMPASFEDGLRRSPAARSAWSALPPSQKKEMLRYFAGLKSALALDRNITRALRVLADGRGRFLGRSWERRK
ncbi:MAG: DUF1905 domain-containing protein [Rhodanobacteraceae bacterium]|nr:MAG: DUF1905 domain-containing protein [Rhodanobacteraceae bacterium]